MKIVIGIVIGLLIGATGVQALGFMYMPLDKWQRFSPEDLSRMPQGPATRREVLMLQYGYLFGVVDAINVANSVGSAEIRMAVACAQSIGSVQPSYGLVEAAAADPRWRGYDVSSALIWQLAHHCPR